MNGEANCTAATAALDFRSVRRSTGQNRCDLPMLSPQTNRPDDGGILRCPDRPRPYPVRLAFANDEAPQTPAPFGLRGVLVDPAGGSIRASKNAAIIGSFCLGGQH